MIEKSEVPEKCKGHCKSNLSDRPAVMIGIDEAGRGPVLGPMVYGAAYWLIEDDEKISALGFDDSKALSPEVREKIFGQMKENKYLGWCTRTIQATEISSLMLSEESNLNEISRNAAVQLINLIRDHGLNVKKVFVDTVGPPQVYERYLTNKFRGLDIHFTVREKADSIFKVVSAASIAAKVSRDKAMENWEWNEPKLKLSKQFGSGYPSDPKTKQWLSENKDDVFGYPDIVRFSWSTIDVCLENAAKFKWTKKSAEAQVMTSFFSGKSKRCDFFERRGISNIEHF